HHARRTHLRNPLTRPITDDLNSRTTTPHRYDQHNNRFPTRLETTNPMSGFHMNRHGPSGSKNSSAHSDIAGYHFPRFFTKDSISLITGSYSPRWTFRAFTSIFTLRKNSAKSLFCSHNLLIVSQSRMLFERAGYTTRDSLRSARCS